MLTDKIIDYRELIARSTAGFVGRQWVRDAIDDFLKQAGSPRHFLLMGEPGSGKTSFLADLVKRRGYPHHFIGKGSQIGLAASLDWRNPVRFAESIGYQLLRDYGGWIMDWESWGISVSQEVKELEGLLIGAKVGQFKATPRPADKPTLTVEQEVERFESAARIVGVYIEKFVMDVEQVVRQLLVTPLRAISERWPGEQVVLVVDGLDEAEDYSDPQGNILEMLPNGSLPANVRFLFSSRPGEHLTSSFLSQVHRFWLSEDEEGWKDPGILEDAETYVARLGKEKPVRAMLDKHKITPQTLGERVAQASQGNFLYLHHYAQGLRGGDETLLVLETLPEGLYGIYADFLDKIKKKREDVSWDGAYKPVLGTLAVAGAPLTRRQIAAFSGVKPGTVGTILVRLGQFRDSMGKGKDKRYSIYHKSFGEYLVSDENEDYIDGQEAHAQVVACYRGKASTWEKVGWHQADDYGLRFLVAHLYTLQDSSKHRQELHKLVQCESFYRERLKRWWNPQPVLDDLHQALELALHDDDLALVWHHIRLYRKIVWEEQDFERLQSSVRAGEYRAALERTRLYAYLPNSQALVRLWIAWEAAANGLPDVARDAIRLALTSLPPDGVVPARVAQADGTARQVVSNIVSETLQRLLVRIAQAVAPISTDEKDWLAQAARAWPEGDVQRIVARLSEPLGSWGAAFDADDESKPIKELFAELGDVLAHADYAPNFRNASYQYHRRLAAGLFNSRDQGEWSGYVQEAVDRISLDDYPSYREVALAWIAAAVLAHDDDDRARDAVAKTLRGAFKASPGFWGDTAATVIAGQGEEKGQQLLADQLLGRLEQLELGQQREVDPTLLHKPEDLIAWRQQAGLPPDPWSHQMRSFSAVAAVLHRRGESAPADELLREAGAVGPEGSYAGFRTLARLSLTCRWLEWDNLTEAKQQIKAARQDASQMLDPVLKKEWLDLVGEMGSWVKDYESSSAHLTEQSALHQARENTGKARPLYVEFLSAVWHSNATLLKRLVPLALDDATATDAVLGRLMGLAAQENWIGPSLTRLVEAMHLED